LRCISYTKEAAEFQTSAVKHSPGKSKSMQHDSKKSHSVAMGNQTVAKNETDGDGSMSQSTKRSRYNVFVLY